MDSFFFFQAEDGIRDLTVTGVQTCALPISSSAGCDGGGVSVLGISGTQKTTVPARSVGDRFLVKGKYVVFTVDSAKIGRASCRERVEISVVAVSLKKKKDCTFAGVSQECAL